MRRLSRLPAWLVALAVAGLAFAQHNPPPPAPPAPAIPTDLDGRWLGEARYQSQTAVVGFDFERKPDGRVLVRLWFPELNTYGTGIDWLTHADGKFLVPAFKLPFTLEGGALSGQLFSADLAFTARRTEKLPTAPPPPAVPTGPEPAWTYRAGAALWTSPAVADGLACLGDASGKFHAVRTADGAPAWTFDAATPLFGNAAVADDAVFFAGDDGHLFKLNRLTGALLWRVDTGGGTIPRSPPSPTSEDWDLSGAAPVVADGVVYIGSADGSFHAVDAATGKFLWQFKAGKKIRAAAAVDASRVYLGSLDRFVYALDRATGALAWKFDTGSAVTTPPVLAGGKLVIGTRDQALLFALDAATGQKLWADYYWMSWVESSPVLVDGRLYIGSSDSQRVRVIDPADGRVVWAAPVFGWAWGTPLVVGDTIYYATAGTPKYFNETHPSLGALDRATGALKWRKPLPYLDGGYVSGIPGSLVLAGGKILAANTDGTLTAYPLHSP